MRREASRATPERARLYLNAGICKRIRSFLLLARLRKFEYKVSSMGLEVRNTEHQSDSTAGFARFLQVFGQIFLQMFLQILQPAHRFMLLMPHSHPDRNTAKSSDIPADCGNLRRAARARAARDVGTNAECDGSSVAVWVVRVIAGRAVYR